MHGRSHDTWVIFSEELRGHARSRWYQFFTLAVVSPLHHRDGGGPALHDRGHPPDGAASAGPQAHRLRRRERPVRRCCGRERSDRYSQPLTGSPGGRPRRSRLVLRDHPGLSAVGHGGAVCRVQGEVPLRPDGTDAFRQLLVNGLIADKVEPAVAARVLIRPCSSVCAWRATAPCPSSLLPPRPWEGCSCPCSSPGLLAFGLTIGSAYMVQSVPAEKESRLVEVVITSASPLSIMGGKLLALVVVGLAQAAVWILAAALTVPRIFDSVAGPGAVHRLGGLVVDDHRQLRDGLLHDDHGGHLSSAWPHPPAKPRGWAAGFPC